MKIQMKRLTYSAVIAAVYAVLTIFLAPISFGFLQCRVSEALTVLPVMSSAAVPGLFIGCLISNIYMGNMIDIIFGSIATLAAAICTRLTRKNKWVAMIFPVIFNAVIVGGYLGLFIDTSKSQPVWLYMLSVGAGQAVACYGLGIPLLNILKKLKITL